MDEITQKIYELKLAINEKGGQLFSIECTPEVRHHLLHKTNIIERNYSPAMRPFETVLGVRLFTNEEELKNEKD